MSVTRFHFALVEDPKAELVRISRVRAHRRIPQTPRRPDPLVALIDALIISTQRSEGSEAWARPHTDHPLAFVLDSLSDAIAIRDPEGRILFANRTARALNLPSATSAHFEEVELGDQRWTRRCIRYHRQPFDLFVEVASRI